jgi:hypothetical protein
MAGSPEEGLEAARLEDFAGWIPPGRKLSSSAMSNCDLKMAGKRAPRRAKSKEVFGHPSGLTSGTMPVPSRAKETI